MASPLMPHAPAAAEPGAMQVLEDAIHLLRAAPFSTLAWHWAGSLPMAAIAVFFWNEVNNPHVPGARLTLEALLTAITFAWLNLCRALFASRLRDQLAGLPLRTPPARDWWEVAAAQTWIGATKLIVLPLAAVSGILLAPAVAYYRTAATLAFLHPRTADLTPRARRLARHRTAQNWRALGLLSCFYVMMLLNVLPTLAALPQLAKMLTGFETPFSRMGASILEDPLFWSLTFALTWLLFDPLVQAVYCVRTFEAESAETGEDVKALLRRLRPFAVALLLICAATSLRAADSIPPPDLHRAIEQAAQSPDYDWRVAPKITERQQPSWFVSTTDRIIAATRAFFRTIGDALNRLLRWIFGNPKLPERVDGAQPPTVTLPIAVWFLLALAIGAAGLAFYRVRIRRPARAAAPAPTPLATAADADEPDPLRFPEQAWIDLAERSIAEQNWRLAMRAFYLANLGWLGRREWIQIHPGKTNREYERDLRRRAHYATEVRDRFAENIAAFERSWYGYHDTTADDVAHFRDRLHQIQSGLENAA